MGLAEGGPDGKADGRLVGTGVGAPRTKVGRDEGSALGTTVGGELVGLLVNKKVG